MVQQTVFAFKLASTTRKVSSFGGLSLLAEALESTGLRKVVEQEFPVPGSNRGHNAWQYFQSLTYLLSCGGRQLSDIRRLSRDSVVNDVLGLRPPSDVSLGRWLRKAGHSDRLSNIADRLASHLAARSRRQSFTFDIDATFIEAHKEGAQYSYHKAPGYYPMTGWLAEEEIAFGQEFRAGNVSPNSGLTAFVDHCWRMLPAGKSFHLLRSDSAGYNSDLFNWCEQHKVKFLVRASRDLAVMRTIRSLPDLTYQNLPATLDEGVYAETVHSMSETKQAFRLIIVRRPTQAALDKTFVQEEDLRIFAIATNDWESEATDLILRYNQRGQAENLIKELKYGYGQYRVPCEVETGNASWFALGQIAYNLGQYLKLFILGGDWICRKVATLRWNLYQLPGLVTCSGRYLRLALRCNDKLIRWLTRMRYRIYQLARDPVPI